MSNDFLNLLNQEQLEAVHYNQSHLGILAGPGSGKTRTLTAKALYLLTHEKIDPRKILVLTFTNKAATEIKHRLNHFTSFDLNQLFVGTFHGFCYRSLSRSEHDIRLATPLQKKKIIEKTKKKYSKKIDIKQKRKQKKNLTKLTFSELELMISRNKKKIDQPLTGFVKMYNQILHDQGLWDYDDLLLKFLQLSGQKKALAYDFLLVDEYQDSNQIQNNLLLKLAGDKSRVTVIGDPNQAIYSFRGTIDKSFQNFQEIFHQVKIIKLFQNYRNPPKILKTSESLLSEEDYLKQKSQVDFSGKVYLIRTLNQYTEADFIVRNIAALIGGSNLIQASNCNNTQNEEEIELLEKIKNKLTFKNFAVLYRNHYLSQKIHQKLDQVGFPYQKVGSGSIWESDFGDFVVIFMKLLKILANDTQQNEQKAELENLLSRLLFENSIFKIKKSLQEKLVLIKKEYQVDLWQAFKIFYQNQSIEQDKNNQKYSLLINFFSQAEKRLGEIMKLSALYDWMVADFGDYFQTKLSTSINHVRVFMTQFDIKETKLEVQIKTFIDWYEQIINFNFYDQKGDKISLLTMHASKGLEFDIVFIIGFEQGLIPSLSPDEDNKHQKVAEEKRLLYVALTRAKKAVILLESEQRFGQKTEQSQFKKVLVDSNLIDEKKDPMMTKIISRMKKKQRTQLDLF